MKTAKEFWKDFFHEYPQNDAEKLAVVMMAEYLGYYRKTLPESPSPTINNTTEIQNAFNRGYNLGHQGGEQGEYHLHPCWEAYIAELNLSESPSPTEPGRTAEEILSQYPTNREYPSYYHESHVLAAMSAYRSMPLEEKGKEGWIRVEDGTPPFIEGKDYSENVFAWCNDELMIMCYCLLPDDNNELCYSWCNCYGKIDGDGEFDDNYYPTHWQPLPSPPVL